MAVDLVHTVEATADEASSLAYFQAGHSPSDGSTEK